MRLRKKLTKNREKRLSLADLTSFCHINKKEKITKGVAKRKVLV